MLAKAERIAPMKKSTFRRNVLAALAVGFCILMFGHQAMAAEVSLESEMDPTTGFSESTITAAQGRINLGSGGAGDADAAYDIATGTTFYGSVIDLFPNQPNEAAFTVGSVSFDDAGLSGVGVELAPITAIDLSGLWADGSATTDISDVGLDLWFGPMTDLSFGALDAADQLTFTDGVLTSIDLSIVAGLSTYDQGFNFLQWGGVFSVSGSALSLAIADTQMYDTGMFGSMPSMLESNLAGTVSSVGSYELSTVPEPSTALITVVGLLGFAFAQRRFARR